MEYAATIEFDGRPYEVKVPALEVPRCEKCGKRVLVDAANREITAALRRAARLLRPEQICSHREALGTSKAGLT